ncbi:hypothetical protein ABZS86_36020 [Streptomyces sp. NPDC005355]|uniref:hypothetical protein n=1 Tax=Streptomyces sp. NPDC005355 TaxID=3157038 RepID=UPI00339FA8EA
MLVAIFSPWPDTADRLDPEHLLELVDERYERLDGRSNSAAKKADLDSTGQSNSAG